MLQFYTDFFDKKLYDEIIYFSKNTTYNVINDDIYNFEYSNFQEVLRNKIEKVFLQKGFIYDCGVLRLQKISQNFLVSKNFHYHSPFEVNSVVCFLNDDFEGGEFVYKNLDESETILKPVTNTAITFPPNLAHKVLPVKRGHRYTLVAFCMAKKEIQKIKKTFI